MAGLDDFIKYFKNYNFTFIGYSLAMFDPIVPRLITLKSCDIKNDVMHIY